MTLKNLLYTSFFIMCVIDNPVDKERIEKFKRSIKRNLTDDRLEYIRQFLENR